MHTQGITQQEFLGHQPAEARVDAGQIRSLVGKRTTRITDSTIRAALRTQDLLVIVAAAVAALLLRSTVPFPEPVPHVVDNLTPIALPIILGWWALLHICGAYSNRILGHGVDEYRRILTASMLAFATLTTGLYLGAYHLPRGFVVALFILGVPLLMVARRVTRAVVNRLRTRGACTKRALLVGSTGAVQSLSTVLRREAWLGLRPVGVLRLKTPQRSEDILDASPDACDIAQAIERANADSVIFCEGSFDNGSDFNQVARQLESHDVQTIVVPALSDISAQRMNLQPVAGLPLVYVEKPRAEDSLKATKRAFDIAFAAFVLAMAMPILLLVALAIRIEDGGPVFFKQQRIGRGGTPFTMFKLRSMVIDAERIRAEMLENANESEVLFKMRHDPRVTRVGRFIRRYSIDELPQLWNVLRGDMSIVGPRPALPAETESYAQHVRRRLDVRPGLTGLWQVSGRSELPWDETVRLDLYYVDNWSMLQDVNILFRTLKAVVGADGAY